MAHGRVTSRSARAERVRLVVERGGFVERVQVLHLLELERGTGAAQRERGLLARLRVLRHLLAPRHRVLQHGDARHRLGAPALRHPAHLVRHLDAVALVRQLGGGLGSDDGVVVVERRERLGHDRRRRGLERMRVRVRPLALGLAAVPRAGGQRLGQLLVGRIGAALEQAAHGHHAPDELAHVGHRVRQEAVVRALLRRGLRRPALAHEPAQDGRVDPGVARRRNGYHGVRIIVQLGRVSASLRVRVEGVVVVVLQRIRVLDPLRLGRVYHIRGIDCHIRRHLCSLGRLFGQRQLRRLRLLQLLLARCNLGL